MFFCFFCLTPPYDLDPPLMSSPLPLWCTPAASAISLRWLNGFSCWIAENQWDRPVIFSPFSDRDPPTVTLAGSARASRHNQGPSASTAPWPNIWGKAADRRSCYKTPADTDGALHPPPRRRCNEDVRRRRDTERLKKPGALPMIP